MKCCTGHKKSIQAMASVPGKTVWTADSSGALRLHDMSVRLCPSRCRTSAGSYWGSHSIEEEGMLATSECWSSLEPGL